MAVLLLVSGSPAYGDSIGVRGAVSDLDADESFDAYELFVVFDLPWAWHPEALHIRTQLEVTGGILDAAGETGFLGAVGPRVAFIADRVSFDAGAGVVALGETEFGDHDFGESSQFTLHAGLTYALTERLNAGVRYRHIFDASMHDGEDLDLVLLELSYDYFEAR